MTPSGEYDSMAGDEDMKEFIKTYPDASCNKKKKKMLADAKPKGTLRSQQEKGKGSTGLNVQT